MKLACTPLLVRLAGIGIMALLTGCQAPTQIAAPTVVAAPATLATAPVYAERRILLTVKFGFDQHSISVDSSSTLNNLAEALKDQRLLGVSYEINGHTDLRGNFAHNIALSAMRAKAVSDFLRDSGVQVPPIRDQGFGPLQLLYPNDPFNPGNRRVEVVAIGP